MIKINILLLGSTGFVGKNIKEFFGEKYEIDSPSHKDLDVRDEKKIKECLENKQYDIVINALDDNSVSDNYLENRMRMFCNLYKYKHLYKKMIWYGSGAEYGRDEPLVNIVESDVDRMIPSDTYGFCLQHMNEMTRQSDNIYNLRLFGIYGKYELWDKRFISNAICKVLYGYPITIRQDRKMSFLYIDDLCKITKWIIDNNPNHHDYNAVPKKSYYLSEIADIIKKVMKSDVPIYIAKEDVFSEYTGNGELLEREMGIEYTSLEKSIEDMERYYKNNIHLINKEKLLYQ